MANMPTQRKPWPSDGGESKRQPDVRSRCSVQVYQDVPRDLRPTALIRPVGTTRLLSTSCRTGSTQHRPRATDWARHRRGSPPTPPRTEWATRAGVPASPAAHRRPPTHEHPTGHTRRNDRSPDGRTASAPRRKAPGRGRVPRRPTAVDADEAPRRRRRTPCHPPPPRPRRAVACHLPTPPRSPP